MKKITIIFMSVLMIFSSCSMDIPYEDINENTETVEEPKEDDIENEESKEEPSKEEDDSENDNDEEGNSENTETVEEPKEDDTENNTEEPSNEESKEDNSENIEIVEDESSNEDVENKTWCEIDEDTKILGLNYFVCVNNSQTKLSPSINNESQAKKDTFLIRGYASKYIEIRVGYNNKKLNFSSVSDSYIITNVMKKDSTINITIKWK